jgi:hypothetical protein
MHDKNILVVSGMVNVIEKSHDFHGEQFYHVMLDVIRLSENVDTIPVIVSEKLLFKNEIAPGMLITIEGQVRTKNQKDSSVKSKLLVFGYASDVNQITEEELLANEIKNQVKMEGFICKVPTHRKTKTGRIITDLLVACNRQYSKSDYVPCITWGINAKMANKLCVGDKVRFTGRFQSREYLRKNDEIGLVNTAYEVSISNIEIINNPVEILAEPMMNKAIEIAQLQTK